MIDGILFPVTVVAALGCGMMAGLFFIFSVAVMPALDRLPPAQSIAATQSINVVILNPLFGLVFGGTAVLCVVLAIASGVQLDEPDAPYALAGSVVYLVGSILLTMGYHVPRNEALDKLDAAGPDAPSAWARYHREWTPWNHVRTVACLAAAALLTVALIN
jgi:uncharacterized membrane protein